MSFKYWPDYSVRDLLLVTMIIILSKSLYYETYGQNLLLVVFACLMVFWAFFTNVILNVRVIIYILALLIIITVNVESQLSSIVVLLLRAVIALLLVGFVGFRKFSEIFCYIVSVLGVISLFSYIIIFFDIPSPFPDFVAIDGRQLRNFLFFGVHQEFIENGIYRNSGLWWEPGAFQVFLSLSLLFYIINNKLTYSKYATYFLFILSTRSTAGMIVLLLALVYLILAKKRYTVVAFGSLFLLIFIVVLGPIVASKFTHLGSKASYSSRFHDVLISLEMFKENILIGYGFGSQIKNAIPFGEKLLGYEVYHAVGNPTGADGLTMFVAQLGILGIVFLIPFLFPAYASHLNRWKRGFLFFCFLAIFNTQNFTFLLIFTVLTFYGIVGNREVLKSPK